MLVIVGIIGVTFAPNNPCSFAPDFSFQLYTHQMALSDSVS